jgi:CRISPR-associated protein Cmr2
MSWQKPDTSYWNNKFAAWWHDPIDKVFNIQGHENWAADYLQIFGMDRPNDEFWEMADAISAGFERGQTPSYSPDANKNGAVDFAGKPVITHPTSEKDHLKMIGGDLNPENIHAATTEYLKKLIGTKAGTKDFAERFKEDEGRFAVARLLYTHLALRFMLAQEDIGGLGALWHRIPADSRFPDHSIWQHNALCSAIYSCIEIGGTPDDVGLMVFSITPVQGFIARARKMRDFWTGSVLLSWLAFEGLRWIIENLGADHILYPSLIDQPLVNVYLEKEWSVSGSFKPELWKGQPSKIASLPNKFLFLIPFGKAEEIAAEIKKAISESWKKIADMTFARLVDRKNIAGDERDNLGKMFERQTSHFWEHQWASARLVDYTHKEELSGFLDSAATERQFDYLDAVNSILEKKGYSKKNTSRGILYSTSHNLAQAALGAGKLRREVRRMEEPGEKCQMCGEFEVLHDKKWAVKSASEYKEFWDKFKKDDDFNENERLCAICFIKRYMPGTLKKKNSHILNRVFGKADSYPSTTMMALTDYFKRNNIRDEEEKRNIADNLHKSKADEFKVSGKKPIKNNDKYYAILMMDGDNMGKLINGESIESNWQGIMHPDIAERLIRKDFDPLYRDAWQKIYSDSGLNQRLVTPAIHAAISEALGDFAIYGVAPIIDQYKGRVIYAGGDDICAFLPAQNALSAARAIQTYYNSAFRFIDSERKSNVVGNEWKTQPGKLSVNLGGKKEISISAAILICHHKESLTQMIGSAQNLLKKEAKDKAGRNACAIELRKRSGGERLLAAKWDDEVWDALDKIAKAAGGKEREVSHSLLYRLEELKPGFDAVIESRKENPLWEKYIDRLISAQLRRSEQSKNKEKNNDESIVTSIRQLILRKKNGEPPKFDALPLQIAAFMGGEDHD